RTPPRRRQRLDAAPCGAQVPAALEHVDVRPQASDAQRVGLAPATARTLRHAEIDAKSRSLVREEVGESERRLEVGKPALQRALARATARKCTKLDEAAFEMLPNAA